MLRAILLVMRDEMDNKYGWEDNEPGFEPQTFFSSPPPLSQLRGDDEMKEMKK